SSLLFKVDAEINHHQQEKNGTHQVSREQILKKLTTVEQQLPEWRTAIMKEAGDRLLQVYSSGKTLIPRQQADVEYVLQSLALMTDYVHRAKEFFAKT